VIGVSVGISVRDENDVNSSFNFHVGKTLQFFADARYPGNWTERVTNVVTWESSNANVATVSMTGLVRAVGPGNADIRATYQGMTGRFGVLVIP
jgi:uncharacterized protein YjdB